MSTYTEQKKTKVTTRRLMEMKQRGEKIACLTSYDFTIASLVDEAGVDLILVGDSASNVMAGNLTTLPITLDEMITYAKGVTRAAKRALVVVDLPFGTYQGNSMEALASAVRVMKEAGAEAVKLEGGSEIRESIERILTAGIPVMGHLGLTPQSINKFGTYSVRAKEEAEARKLEKVPAELAQRVASLVSVPVIGIGAGGGVDGQILVFQDMMGMNHGFSPKFLRRYADLASAINAGVSRYVEDVKNSEFPNADEQY